MVTSTHKNEEMSELSITCAISLYIAVHWLPGLTQAPSLIAGLLEGSVFLGSAVAAVLLQPQIVKRYSVPVAAGLLLVHVVAGTGTVCITHNAEVAYRTHGWVWFSLLRSVQLYRSALRSSSGTLMGGTSTYFRRLSVLLMWSDLQRAGSKAVARLPSLHQLATATVSVTACLGAHVFMKALTANGSFLWRIAPSQLSEPSTLLLFVYVLAHSVGFVFFLIALFQSFDSIFAIVIPLGWSVTHPPIMRHPLLSNSMRDLWGSRWNRSASHLFRDSIASLTGYPLTVTSRAAVFLLSAALHASQFAAVSAPYLHVWMVAAFFALQGIGVMAFPPSRVLTYCYTLILSPLVAHPALTLLQPWPYESVAVSMCMNEVSRSFQMFYSDLKFS